MDESATLSPEDHARYERQVTLPQVGTKGQRALARARVLVVGAGGLGCPAALYLAAAGVGHLVLVDDDRVARSNLHRQVAYIDAEVGRLKVECLASRLRGLNPQILVTERAERLGPDNADVCFANVDVIVDGSDNFATRYGLGDAAWRAGIPVVSASVLRFEGQMAVYVPGAGPCQRCVFPEPPPRDAVPTCTEGGVLGVLPGILGVQQAAEALRLILGYGDSAAGRLQRYDGLGGRFQTLKTQVDPACQLCGPKPVRQPWAESVAGACEPFAVTAGQVAALRNGASLVDVRSDLEWASGAIPGAIHVPMEALDGTRLPSGDLILYCRTGARSARARVLLGERGVAAVQHLAGGIEAWRRAGFDLVLPGSASLAPSTPPR